MQRNMLRSATDKSKWNFNESFSSGSQEKENREMNNREKIGNKQADFCPNVLIITLNVNSLLYMALNK